MLPSDVKAMMFALLDQAERADVSDRRLVRECLCRVVVGEGQPITDEVLEYIEMLVEEFCPTRRAARQA
jgi:hypothetical protein